MPSEGSSTGAGIRIDANRELVRSAVLAGMVEGDIDLALSAYAPDVDYHAPIMAATPDRVPAEVMAGGIRATREAFPDLDYRIEALVAEHDLVAVVYRWTGTHTGPLGGLPPTGHRVAATGAILCRLAGGRIVEQWDVDDRLDVMTQLGLGPDLAPQDAQPAPALALDRLLPDPEQVLVHTAVFRAPPEITAQAFLDLDVLESRLIRMLMGARGLLGRSSDGPRPSFRIRDLPQLGWTLLAAEPPSAGVHQTVFGIATRPWQLAASPPGPVTGPDQFARFDQPGYLRIATGIRTAPYGEHQSVLTVETRMAATDPASRRRFLRYWKLVEPFSALIRWRAMGLLHERLNRAG